MAILNAEQNHRLVLHAKSVDLSVQPTEALPALLGRIGFIGSQCHENETDSDYLTGDRFLDLVSFLGCSPNIALSPEDGDTLGAVGKAVFSWEPMEGAAKYFIEFTMPSGQPVTFEAAEPSHTRYMESFPTSGDFT